jgi:hypothetical protein
MMVSEYKCDVSFGGQVWRAGTFYRDSMILNRIGFSADEVYADIDVSRSLFPGAPFPDFSLKLMCSGVVQFAKIDRQFYESRGLEAALGDSAYGVCCVERSPDFFGMNSAGPYISFGFYDDIVFLRCRTVKLETHPPMEDFRLIK